MATVEAPTVTVGTKFGPVGLVLDAPDSIRAYTHDDRPLTINGVAYELYRTPMFPHPDGSGAWVIGSRSTYQDKLAGYQRRVWSDELRRNLEPDEWPDELHQQNQRQALNMARYALGGVLRRVDRNKGGKYQPEPTPAARKRGEDELMRVVSVWAAEHFGPGSELAIEAAAYRRAYDAGTLAADLDRLRDKLPELADRAELIGCPGVLHKLDVARRGIGAAAVTLREVQRGER